MKIVVLRKMEYEGLFIYIMQFGTTFQYIFSINGDIYQDNIDIKPSLKRKLRWMIGRTKTPYTPDELDEGEKIVLSGAMETIDKLKASGELTRQASRQREAKIEKVKEHREKMKGIPCEWQSMETIDGWYYRCLIHGHKVKVGKEGEKPYHD